MDLNASTCQSFTLMISEKSKAISSTSTRKWRSQLLEADNTVITLCSMQCIHVHLYRRRDGGKNLWQTKLSIPSGDYLPALHFFGSEVGVSSRAKFVQRTYKPLSQPRRPAMLQPEVHFFWNAFEYMWFPAYQVTQPSLESQSALISHSTSWES